MSSSSSNFVTAKDAYCVHRVVSPYNSSSSSSRAPAQRLQGLVIAVVVRTRTLGRRKQTRKEKGRGSTREAAASLWLWSPLRPANAGLEAKNATPTQPTRLLVPSGNTNQNRCGTTPAQPRPGPRSGRFLLRRKFGLRNRVSVQ